MKIQKIIRNSLIAVASLLLLVLVALQIILRPSVLTSLVNDFAADYVEGDISFGNIKAHVIKSFPYLNLEADNFALTYPHDRYAQYDSIYRDNGRRFSLLRAGRSEEVDTLASFRNLSVSINYMGILTGRGYHIRKAELTHPRIFAHYYDSTAANWDILPIGSDDEDTPEDSTKKPLPRVIVNKIHMSDKPFIVYTNPKDTLFGMFMMRRLNLDGRIDTKHIEHMESALEIDSLFVSGRLPSDTVSVALRSLRAQGNERHISLDARAHAWLATSSFGRLKVPIGLTLDGDFPERKDDTLEVQINSAGIELSALALKAQGNVKACGGAYDMDLEAHVEDCPLGQIIEEYENNVPLFKKVTTDAHLSMDAVVKGTYAKDMMPSIDARLKVPTAMLDYEGLGRTGKLGLDATLTTDDLKQVDAQVHKLLFDIAGAKIKATAGIQDVLGDDPLVLFDAKVRARVDSLTHSFTLDRGITGTGTVDAKLHGKIRQSQLDMQKIGWADILCNLTASNLSIQDVPDSIDATIPALDVELATRANKIDRNLKKGARVLALKVKTDSLDAQYGNLSISGGNVLLLMQNAADILRGGKNLTSFMGLLKMGRLKVSDTEGLGLRLSDNTESFRITPASKDRPVPKLSLRSSSARVGVRNGFNFYALRDLKFSASASKHQSRRFSRARRDHLLDSLQRVYPGVPRDSLFRKSRMDRLSRMPKDEFASSDIKIGLSKALQSYARQWDIEGELNLKSGRIWMPSFPLKTRISSVEGSFDNDTLDLGNITINAGASDLSARANLSGLRRALTGRGRPHMKLKANVTSNYLDVNELMRGYAYYSSYEPPKDLENASDSEIESATQNVELPDSAKSKLIIIPSNLDVDFNLEANGIKYDSLNVSWAAADVAMRDRTIQVTNAIAASNMGDLYFEGFYSTRSKKDLKAGFDLNLVNITAEKVITLFPSVDTLMPMLTSFAGDLDCELAATTEIDTMMNLVIPSVDGILKISGSNLNLKDSKDFTKIAKLLMFKDKNKARIDNMSVTGMMRENRIDIFPFVINVDRYLVAASGQQVMDEWMDYHISVIKSPLLFKFGINARGKDFDHVKYSLGKARYKNANVPVYTKQLDTVQYSLLAAIHNIFELGVEKAMQENRTSQYLSQNSSAPVSDTESEATALSTSEMQNMSSFQDNIEENVTARREAIKQEILTLSQPQPAEESQDSTKKKK